MYKTYRFVVFEGEKLMSQLIHEIFVGHTHGKIFKLLKIICI